MDALMPKLLSLFATIAEPRLLQQIQYLQIENQILRRRIKGQIHTNSRERNALLEAGLPVGKDLRRLISIVQYQTFLKWKRLRYLRLRKKRSRKGRPKIQEHIRRLAVKLATENAWGYTRILGELWKLKVFKISKSSIKNILRQEGIFPAPHRPNDNWHKFIKRHAETLWCSDFFTKSVWTFQGLRTYYILFYLNVKTRTVHIAGITDHPDQEWVIAATKQSPFIQNRKDQQKLLIHDGDAKFSKKFRDVLLQYNTRTLRIPPFSPNLNAYAESWVGKIKAECLDHFIVFGEQHLEYLVREYVRYYDSVRPHQGLDNQPLRYTPARKRGKLKTDSRLGGLLNHYYRE